MKIAEHHFGPVENGELSIWLGGEMAGSKKIILADENVFALWGEKLITSVDGLSEAEVIQIPQGEESKCIEICIQVWESLTEYTISRNDLLINFGGGMISDLGGFIAATYKRGMPFINIPTTLLAMVDASIGGKTGINISGIKNQIGSFHSPQMIWCDKAFLSTLSDEQKLSGFAEMIKHGLIADRNHFEKLRLVPSPDLPVTDELIRHSSDIKEHFVKLDYRDTNVRKILNFGHTTGHALETLFMSKGESVFHGHCIAWGMITAAHLSMTKKKLSEKEFAIIDHFIRSRYPSPEITAGDLPVLVKLIENDKKNTSKNFRFVLLTEIGKAIPNILVKRNEIIAAMEATLCS